MGQTIKEVMTPNPVTIQATSTLQEAARLMKDSDIGDVLVMGNGGICGIVTDRDIAIRAVAEGLDPGSTKVGDVCTSEVMSLSPKDSVDQAVRLMREKAIRRLPILDGDHPVGIVSLGDLAIEKDPKSALAAISEAPPQS